MKYMVFKEQVADQFGIGSHDVCIVGSAKLGFSPSAHKYGTAFHEASDVDVVVISEPLFHEGSQELFRTLNALGPAVGAVRPHVRGEAPPTVTPPTVALRDWMTIQESLRNYIYRNFNPGLLPPGNRFRETFFDAIASTAGLFLALEPKVVVSRIRGRVFRDWKAAEDYYSNSLRELRQSAALGEFTSPTSDDDD